MTRYGGEEFAIICPYPTLEEAAQSAELGRITVLEEKIPHSDSMISDYVTIAMVVASIIPVDNNPRRLVELAVANLYKAMRNGRNQVVAD